MTRIFIPGGAGYVGSALVPGLLDRGYEVIVYDLFMYGDIFSNIKNPGLTQIKADVRDRDKVIDSSKGCDAIIHLACISNDPSFELDPELGKSINLDAFYHITEAAQINKISRLIYASSSSVYGLKEEKNVTEEASLEPLTDYSRYKAACEKILRDSELPWVVVRPATVCGYARRLRLDVVVNILTINALANNKIKVFGGSQLRPNINIKDMVRVYELLLEAPMDKILHNTFNAGYQNLTVLEIGKMVQKICGEQIPLVTVPTDDNRSYHINSDKLSQVLGFRPKFTVEEAIQTLKDAFDSLNDPMNNPMYYNIKRMQELHLK